ncbi:MAG: hypothetical protein QOF68_1493, partial [Gaiellales bacterium]|nr:hypothetical protein [Gaiellales bacterium]
RLLASGEDVLVVVADRVRRLAMTASELHPGRFGGGDVALAEWDDLPAAAAGFGEVIVLDPPADERSASTLALMAEQTRVHLVWGAAEVTFTRSVVESREPLRPALAAVFRAQRDCVTPLLPPETVALCNRVLDELGIDPASPPAGRFDLELSTTYRAAQERCAQAVSFLARLERGELPTLTSAVAATG